MWRMALIGIAAVGLIVGCQERKRTQPHTRELVPVTELDFDEMVLRSDQPVLVDFYADWCGPCEVLEPTLEELAAEYKGRVILARVDIDDDAALADRYGVSAIPTLILFVDGKTIERIRGVVPKETIAASLDKHVPESKPAKPEPGGGARKVAQ